MTKEWNNVLCEEVVIDVNALIEKVNETSLVFEDSYGNGVCLVNNKSYATYHELAKDFDLHILDFVA